MQQNLARRFSLRDIGGNLVADHSVLGLSLSEPSDIVPGEFYLELPTGNFFYCQGIESGLIHWLCIESYQHGQLYRAELKQKVGHATSFVPVRNQKKLKELHKLLANLLSLKSG
jgi:hypothetical protein